MVIVIIIKKCENNIFNYNMSLKILTLKKWLKLFNLDTISKKQFLVTFNVKTKKSIPLKNYLKTNKLSKKDIDLLYFFIIENKKQYLINFYNKSLKIADLDLTNITLSFSNNKNPKYKNLIRNIYYKDILLYTKTEIPNIRSFLEVLLELFNKNTIDYKLVTPSSIAMLYKGLFSNILSGFYFRSSILNPCVLYTLSKQLKGSNIFTPTLGWSSYMYGFLSNSNITEYVGTDVIEDVCVNTKLLSSELFPKKKIDIYFSPSENLKNNKKFIKKYKRKYFDNIFFSPPYFKLEIYRGKLQSTNLYSKYEDWLLLYWEETIKLCRYLIKNNGVMCYIISNYKNRINMNRDMNNITKKYFKLTKKIVLNNSNINFTSHNDNSEIIYFFKPLKV